MLKIVSIWYVQAQEAGSGNQPCPVFEHEAEEERRPACCCFAQQRVLVNEQEVALTPTEFDLLTIFITYRGKVLTKQALVNYLWGEQAGQERTHSLHVYIALLRQKIEPVPIHPRLILTIPDVGYRFTDD